MRNRTKPGKFVYRHPRPMLTADAVVLAQMHGKLHVLLVKRKYKPFKGYWALPGGFVEHNEQALDAAKRELAEETGLRRIRLKPMGFFDAPGRDPRGWTVSVVHLAFVTAHQIKQLRPGDDASELAFCPLPTRTKLAFDHAEIVRYSMRWWKNQK